MNHRRCPSSPKKEDAGEQRPSLLGEQQHPPSPLTKKGDDENGQQQRPHPRHEQAGGESLLLQPQLSSQRHRLTRFSFLALVGTAIVCVLSLSSLDSVVVSLRGSITDLATTTTTTTTPTNSSSNISSSSRSSSSTDDSSSTPSTKKRVDGDQTSKTARLPTRTPSTRNSSDNIGVGSAVVASYNSDVSVPDNGTKVLFLHMGKAGGGTIDARWETSTLQVMRDAYSRCHPNPCPITLRRTVSDVAAKNRRSRKRKVVLISIRDPVDRFISAFYWRKLMLCAIDMSTERRRPGPPLSGGKGEFDKRFCVNPRNRTGLVREQEIVLGPRYNGSAEALARALCSSSTGTSSSAARRERARKDMASIKHSQYSIADWLLLDGKKYDDDDQKMRRQKVGWEKWWMESLANDHVVGDDDDDDFDPNDEEQGSDDDYDPNDLEQSEDDDDFDPAEFDLKDNVGDDDVGEDGYDDDGYDGDGGGGELERGGGGGGGGGGGLLYPIVMEPNYDFDSQVEEAVRYAHFRGAWNATTAESAAAAATATTVAENATADLAGGGAFRHSSGATSPELKLLSEEGERCVAEYYADDYKILRDLLQVETCLETCRNAIRSILQRRRWRNDRLPS